MPVFERVLFAVGGIVICAGMFVLYSLERGLQQQRAAVAPAVEIAGPPANGASTADVCLTIARAILLSPAPPGSTLRPPSSAQCTAER